MWTRKDIVEFKQSIKQEGPAGIINIGNGETVTIRVPTHVEGTCIFWEFAADGHDLGFGVFFEWTAPSSNTVSVHVTELTEDEDDNEIRDEIRLENGKRAWILRAGICSDIVD